MARRSSRCIRRNVTRKKTISCPTRRRVVATNRQENKLWQTRKNKKEKKKRNEPPGYFQRCLYYRGRSGALLSEGTRAPRSNDEGEKKLAPPPPPLGSAGGIRAKKKWRLRASVTGQNIRKQPETLLWDKGAMPSVIVRPSKCGKLLLDCCTWRALHTYIHTYVRTYVRTRAQRVIFTAYTAARPRL